MARKTKEELLEEAKERVEKLKKEIKEAGKKQKAKLTIDSEGVKGAIDAIKLAADANGSTLAEVIKAIASIKRTGLTIANAVRKAKKI